VCVFILCFGFGFFQVSMQVIFLNHQKFESTFNCVAFKFSLHFFVFHVLHGFCYDNHCGAIVLFHLFSFVSFIRYLGHLNPRKSMGTLDCEKVVLKKTW